MTSLRVARHRAALPLDFARCVLLALTLVLAIGACGGAPKEIARGSPAATTKAPAPAEDPCDKARRQRARVPDLLAHGKLDRTVRVLRHADKLCPASAAESWMQLVQTLAEVGRYEEAKSVADEIEHDPKVTDEARAAVKTARASMAEREGYFPNTTEAKGPMRELFSKASAALDQAEKTGDLGKAKEARDAFLAAWNAWRPNGQSLYGAARMARRLGDEAGAQRLYDRAVVELETYARHHMKLADAALRLDTPNGFGIATANSLTGGTQYVSWSARTPLLAVSDRTGISILNTRTWRPSYWLPLLAGTPELAGERVLFSPDGKLLAIASLDRIRIWDVETAAVTLTFNASGRSGYAGQRLHDPLRVDAMAFSPDSRALATSISDQKIVRLWDVATGEQRGSFEGHERVIRSTAFSPDGSVMATASDDSTARLWDVATQKAIHVLRGHGAAAHGVAFSPDGRTLASNGDDETIRLWDVKTGKPLRVIRHSSSFGALLFTPDGKSLVTNSADWLLDVATGKSVHRRANDDGALALSPAGDLLAEARYGLRLYSTATGKLVQTIQQPHAEGVVRLAFSPSGEVLAAGSSAGMLWLWDSTTGRLKHSSQEHGTFVRAIAMSADARWMASADYEHVEIALWTAAGARVRPLAGHTKPVNALAFSPDSQILASASRDNTVRLWRAESGELVRTLDVPTAAAQSLAFDPGGTRLAAASGTVFLCDVATGRIEKELGAEEADVVYSLDGKTLFTAGDGVEIWDASSGAKRGVLGQWWKETWFVNERDGSAGGKTGRARNLALREGATMLAITSTTVVLGEAKEAARTGTSDRLDLYELPSAKHLRTLEGHTDIIHSIAFRPRSSFLASASRDGSIRFWSLGDERVLVVRAVAETRASYLFTEGPDARIEFFSDEGRKYPICRVGPLTYEFDLCAERFEQPDLGKTFLANDLSYLDP